MATFKKVAICGNAIMPNGKLLEFNSAGQFTTSIQAEIDMLAEMDCYEQLAETEAPAVATQQAKIQPTTVGTQASTAVLGRT